MARKEKVKGTIGNEVKTDAFAELERGVYSALETYSNVHRGSGYNSIVSTHLYELARDLVLEYMGLKKGQYRVIFCSPRIANGLMAQLKPRNCHCVSSRDIGLPLGVSALAVKRKALPKGAPFQTGGGTARLVSRDWIIWAGGSDKFEAGTPAIVNVIAFARALQLVRHLGIDTFLDTTSETLTATEILYSDELEQYTGRELLDKLRLTLISRGITVPTTEGIRPYINLDNGASTPTFSPIWNVVRQTWRQPKPVHQEIIHEVRSICSGALGAPLTAYDVIFTSNATEAINLVAESWSHESEEGTGPVIINTLLEHSSNDLPWRMVPGSSLIRLSIDSEGFVDLKELETLLGGYNGKNLFGKKRIRLVAVSGASNVLGVYNNLEEISRIVHQYGAQLLVDAAQLVAHRKVGMEESGIDYLAFSAHKVYAPFGCGVLVVKKGLLNFTAGELQQIQSSGEENAVGIAALGKALVLLQRIGMDLIQKEEQALTGRALRGMEQIAGLRVFGIKDPDSPRFAQKGGVIVFAVKGLMSDRVAKELAVRGIGVRYGCHCAHILIKHLLGVSPGLEKFQRVMLTLLPMVRLPGLTRVSLGIQNTEEEIDTLIQVLGTIGKTRASSGRHSAVPPDESPVLQRAEVERQLKDLADVAAQRVYS